jgi:hypothetical protein
VALRSRGPRLLMLALAAVAAAVAVTAGTAAPAHAALGIACPDSTSQPFAPWGDYASYVRAPDGGFENGAAGWTLTGGARVVSGNESFGVGGAGQRHSLALPAGSSATSPPMCIGLLSSQMRLFTANAGATASKLRVQVVYGGGTGALLGALGATLGVSDQGTLTSGAGWQPSVRISMLGGVLPLLTQSVRFRFTPLATGGNWRIDDVYLDPLMHR